MITGPLTVFGGTWSKVSQGPATAVALFGVLNTATRLVQFAPNSWKTLEGLLGHDFRKRGNINPTGAMSGRREFRHS